MKKRKIRFIGLVFILILILIGNSVSAFSIGNLSGNTADTGEIQQAGNKVVQIVSTVGSILSVIVIILSFPFFIKPVPSCFTPDPLF